MENNTTLLPKVRIQRLSGSKSSGSLQNGELINQRLVITFGLYLLNEVTVCYSCYYYDAAY